MVLSDHGQSQGAPFRQRYGETLEQVAHRLMHEGDRTGAATGQVEEWGPLNVLLTGVTGQRGPTGAAARTAMRARMIAGDVTFGPAGRETQAIERGHPELIVVASGNLAMVYLTGSPNRYTAEELAIAYPVLLKGLAQHPGVGFVVVHSAELGPVAIGADGTHALRTGAIEGLDPLEGYGPLAAQDLLAHQEMANVGDLVVMSRLDAGTDEVAAFEELVGCHGGLGGDQTEAVLVYPAAWRLHERPVSGPGRGLPPARELAGRARPAQRSGPRADAEPSRPDPSRRGIPNRHRMPRRRAGMPRQPTSPWRCWRQRFSRQVRMRPPTNEISTTRVTAATIACHGSGKIARPARPIDAYTAAHSRDAAAFATAKCRHGTPNSAAASSTGTRPPGMSRETSSTGTGRAASWSAVRCGTPFFRSHGIRLATPSPPQRSIA